MGRMLMVVARSMRGGRRRIEIEMHLILIW